MPEQHGKTFLLIVTLVCVVLPLIGFIFYPTIGALSLMFGLLALWRAVRLVHNAQRETEENPYDRIRSESARTIFVQLVDEQGVALSPADARAKLEAAHQLAGPRDAVVGVRRIVAE